jgi:hypothetical protein
VKARIGPAWSTSVPEAVVKLPITSGWMAATTVRENWVVASHPPEAVAVTVIVQVPGLASQTVRDHEGSILRSVRL